MGVGGYPDTKGEVALAVEERTKDCKGLPPLCVVAEWVPPLLLLLRLINVGIGKL
jgi:hypothetical protein